MAKTEKTKKRNVGRKVLIGTVAFSTLVSGAFAYVANVQNGFTERLNNMVQMVEDFALRKDGKIAELNNTIETLTNAKEALEGDLATANASILDLQSQIEEKDGQIAELTATIADLEANIAEMTETIAGLEADILDLEAEIERLQLEGATDSETITNLQTTIQEKETEIAGLEADIASKEETIADLTGQVETLTAEKEELQQQVTNLQNAYNTVIANIPNAENMTAEEIDAYIVGLQEDYANAIAENEDDDQYILYLEGLVNQANDETTEAEARIAEITGGDVTEGEEATPPESGEQTPPPTEPEEEEVTEPEEEVTEPEEETHFVDTLTLVTDTVYSTPTGNYVSNYAIYKDKAGTYYKVDKYNKDNYVKLTEQSYAYGKTTYNHGVAESSNRWYLS